MTNKTITRVADAPKLWRRSAARLVAAVILACSCAGCGSQATVDLIAVGRAGLADAKIAQLQMHEEIMAALIRQAAALDAAFDADVRLIESGGLIGADGEPVELSAEWVISARMGYSVAMSAITGEVRSAEAAHAVRMDNIEAADESLAMAAQLVLRWSVLSAKAQQQLTSASQQLAEGD